MRLHAGFSDFPQRSGFGSNEEPGFLTRLFLWLVRASDAAMSPRPIRVYYQFGSGGWRSRSTSQLYKVNRCR